MTKSSTPLLSVRQLSMRSGKTHVLSDINLDTHKGEVLVVIGPSGSGKSTLIRCLNGLESPFEGTIDLMGSHYHTTRSSEWARLRNHVGMVFQDYSLFSHMSVLQNMTLAPVLRGKGTQEECEQHALELLDRVQLKHKATSMPADLSGGQQQCVTIVRALTMQPEIMCFDEPTSALDPEMVKEVLDTMIELAETGITMICVTHEMGFAREVATPVNFMDHGELIVSDEPSRFFSNHEYPRLQGFLKNTQPFRPAAWSR